MDETTKVLIGTISGFVIAFFAEPIKTFFLNRSKTRNLRIILYREAFYNYTQIKVLSNAKDAIELRALLNLMILRDGYQYAKSQEISLFYIMKEAHLFSALNMIVETLSNVADDVNSDNLKNLCLQYQELIMDGVKSGSLNKRLVKKFGIKSFQTEND